MDEVTIGKVWYDGQECDVDWPFTLDDDSVREDFAVIYLDGEQVGEFINPNWEPFEDTEQVLELAQGFVNMGGLD